MKLKVSPILLGIVVVAVALYVYKQRTTPTLNIVMKKEGFECNLG